MTASVLTSSSTSTKASRCRASHHSHGLRHQHHHPHPHHQNSEGSESSCSSSSSSCSVFDDYLAHCQRESPLGWDRLLFACQQNKIELVRYLVDQEGVAPFYKNPVGQSALHIAARYGHVECLSFLLSCLPSTDEEHEQVNEQGHEDVVNAQNRLTGATPLHSCLQTKTPHKNSNGTSLDEYTQEQLARRLTCAHLLIQAGANLEIPDHTGKTPLEYWRENFETTTTDVDDEAEQSTDTLLHANIMA